MNDDHEVANRLAHHLEVASVRGLVQILCDARLVMILAIVVRGILDGSGPAAFAVIIGVPLSWLPLRHWSRRPELFHRAAPFAGVDSLVTILVIVFSVAATGAWELGVAYLFLSAALAGTLARRGTAILATAIMAGGTILLLQVIGLDLVWVVAVPLCALGVAYASSSLSAQLRKQGRLARRLLTAQAAEAAQHERAELAREMHDSLAKTLHGVEMIVGVLSDDLEAHGAPEASMAHRAREACATARREAREVLTGLRKDVSTDIVQALRIDGSRWADYHGIRLSVHAETEVRSPGLTPSERYHVRRIAGELLENVARHAQASTVRMTVAEDEDTFELAVEDDGIGMHPRPSAELALDGHFGLAGIRERLALLGGDLRIDDAPGGGARARVRVPRTVRLEAELTEGVTS